MSIELRTGSLCSGYEGLEMGIQAVIGGTVAWHVEKDPNASRILTHHWPDVPNHGDLITVDWTTVEPVDVLTADRRPRTEPQRPTESPRQRMCAAASRRSRVVAP